MNMISSTQGGPGGTKAQMGVDGEMQDESKESCQRHGTAQLSNCGHPNTLGYLSNPNGEITFGPNEALTAILI